MREVVYTAFMSLAGVVDSPGGGPGEDHPSAGWVFKDIEFVPEVYGIKGEELEETAALMFGRRSYEAFAPVWRDSEDHAAYKPAISTGASRCCSSGSPRATRTGS
jgi:hypothetical protein